MQDTIKKKVVHPALGMGCTSCHNPHGSAARKFLSADGAALCYQCHSPIEDKLKSAKSVHPPIKSERGCASCHSPHASDEPKLLAKSGKGLCLGCHKDLIKKTQTVLHGPVRDGCTSCHEPHGTPNEKLLLKPYSTDFYVAYNDTEFPLCFSCHNRDLLRFPTTSYATGFRDGEKNLHYLHVNRKDRGRRCKACHVVHAGENPKLIADRVPFGKWNLPLKFVKTETGGGCSPGCHQPFAYDRKNPAKGAPPAADKDKSKKKKK
jgi:predicted CXXCH cytochrome family protein